MKRKGNSSFSRGRCSGGYQRRDGGLPNFLPIPGWKGLSLECRPKLRSTQPQSVSRKVPGYDLVLLLKAVGDEVLDLSTAYKVTMARTSSHKVLTLQQYGFYLVRLGSAAGFKERLAYYCNGRHSQCFKDGAPPAICGQTLRPYHHGSTSILTILERICRTTDGASLPL